MLLNEDLLKKILSGFGINTVSWGKGRAKTAAHLLNEIQEGECYLKISDSGISRMVEVIPMFIHDPSRPERGCLLEWSQTLPDGRIRQRKQTPCGKIKKGETPREALIREIKEELNLDQDGFLFSAMPTKLWTKQSGSYPGLPCLYIMHGFDVVLNQNSPALQDSFTVKTGEDGSSHLFRWGELTS